MPKRQKLFWPRTKAPNDRETELLIANAKLIEPEYVTIIKMATEAGVTPFLTLDLGPEKLDTNAILLKAFNSKKTLRRRVSPELLTYLKTLPGPYFCPRLRAMKQPKRRYLWVKIRRAVNKRFSLPSLVWQYRREHAEELKLEELIGELERLASEFLTEAECIALRLQIPAWRRLPPTKQLRRRRTREEILGEITRREQ